MTTRKRLLIATVASAVTVAVVWELCGAFPGSVLSKAFVFSGLPLGNLIFHLTPDSFLRELAPQGGPDVIGWAIGLGALLTWFAALLLVWFVALGRMRSNSALLTDTYTSPLRAQHGAAKRER